MAAFIFALGPAQSSSQLPGYSDVADHLADDGQALERWPAGDNSPVPGDDAWLLAAQGGLVGHGVVVPGAHSGYVDVAVDSLLPLGDEIPAAILAERLPDVQWATEELAGAPIPPALEAAVRFLWAEYVPLPEDPTTPPPGTLPAECLTASAVNRHEWDVHARSACIAHHGTSCSACGFSFESVYGAIGKGFIQVHHIVPVSLVTHDYELDPISDLVPLCPNCHAMVHRRVPVPYTPAELRRIISTAGYLSGTLVSPEEQYAQDEAIRLLGPDTSDG